MADPAEARSLPAQGSRPVSVLKIAGTDMVAKWDYDRVLAENEELKGWAVVGQRGHCPHSKTVKDCAGCTIRVLMATQREILGREQAAQIIRLYHVALHEDADSDQDEELARALAEHFDIPFAPAEDDDWPFRGMAGG